MEAIAESISCYLFKEIRDENSTEDLDMEWLINMTNFYRNLIDLSDFSENDDKYVYVEISDKLSHLLPRLIEKYIFKEIRDLVEDDIEWVCAMTYLYNQLKKFEENDANAELKYKNDNIDTLDEQDILNSEKYEYEKYNKELLKKEEEEHKKEEKEKRESLEKEEKKEYKDRVYIRNNLEEEEESLY
jgi:hypothetical protein